MGCPTRFLPALTTHPGKRLDPEKERGNMSMPSLVFPVLAEREMTILTYLIKIELEAQQGYSCSASPCIKGHARNEEEALPSDSQQPARHLSPSAQDFARYTIN